MESLFVFFTNIKLFVNITKMASSNQISTLCIAPEPHYLHWTHSAPFRNLEDISSSKMHSTFSSENSFVELNFSLPMESSESWGSILA
jgi:hypothetical protein